MKKLMNRKGFTLVELLAVIVILAVIILVAMNAVIPQMEKARKSSFLTEVETFAKAAETYFASEALAQPTILTTGGCVTVDYLKANYVNKSDKNYTGVACIENNNVYLALTSGAYSYNGIVTGKDSAGLEQGIWSGNATKENGDDQITKSVQPTGYSGSVENATDIKSDTNTDTE